MTAAICAVQAVRKRNKGQEPRRFLAFAGCSEDKKNLPREQVPRKQTCEERERGILH